MSGTPQADRAAREAAQTVFDRPLLLEAGAGTGKTTTLVARVLAWCLGEGWDRTQHELENASDESVSGESIATETLQGVVAITFTEAAAAEMAERLAVSLARIVDGEEQDVTGFDPSLLPGPLGGADRRRRATRLLESFDYLTVGTIHSFCYGLLRNYPLEAGLHPELRVDADGRELETVGRTAVEQWIQDAYTAGADTPFLALAARGIGPGRLLEAILHWSSEGHAIDILEPDPLGPSAIEEFLADLQARAELLVGLIGDRLNDLTPKRVARRVQETLLRTAALLVGDSTAQSNSLEERLDELRDLWPESDAKRIQNWSRGKFTGEESARLESIGSPLAAACDAFGAGLRTASGLDPGLLAAARAALLPLLRQVDSEMRSRGAITFSGLLRETLALLEKSPSVLERERRRIRLLLVDEFQDTDPRQSEIVRLLGLEGATESRPSLFVVGDPKQSIYAWRDADLAAYEAFERALVAEGGARHSLEVNFRSTTEILDEVERAISPVMRYEHGVQPKFHGLSAAPAGRATAKEVDGDRWRPIEYWVSWAPDAETGRLAPGPISETLELEAYELATDIRRLHDLGGVPWNRIGVLFRKGSSQPFFLDEMRRQDIPFAVTRDRNYYQRREVIEAAAWVRAIVNPTDHLALLTVLRSMVVGVPDAALLPLWSASFPKLVTELGGPESDDLEALRDAVGRASSSIPGPVPGLDRLRGWEESLMAALGSLSRLRASYRRDAPDVFVRALRAELLAEVSEAARFQGKFRLANLQRFFRQLESAMESEEADVHAILRALRLGVTQAREAEEAMPRDAAEEAVQVMTIHTAKGLEFDHVYVAQLHARTRKGSDDLAGATEVEPGKWQYRLFGANTLGYEEAERRREHVESAEMVRTLYVAMTRACRRLVLIGRWPESPAASDPLDANDYIDLLQNRAGLPPSLSEPANDPQTQLLGQWDQADIRWRFLGGSQKHRATCALPPSADWLPTKSEISSSAVAHQRRAEQAEQRMERVWIATATSGISTRLEEAAAVLATDGNREPSSDAAHRRAARESGTAVHQCLEEWRFDEDPTVELERQLHRIEAAFAGEPELIERATSTLKRFASGALLRQLRELAPHFLGREIPLLMPPTGEDTGPIGAYSGAIDLLYRDPSTDALVVADFKTDRVEDAEALARRAEVYRPQEELYAKAVQEMMGLAVRPRSELWFLWADTVIRSSSEGS